MGKKRYVRLDDDWYQREGKWEIYSYVYDDLLDYASGGNAIFDWLGELSIITKDWEFYDLDDILAILDEYREKGKLYYRMPKNIRRLFEDAIIIIVTSADDKLIFFKNYDVLREARRRGLI